MICQGMQGFLINVYCYIMLNYFERVVIVVEFEYYVFFQEIQ